MTTRSLLTLSATAAVGMAMAGGLVGCGATATSGTASSAGPGAEATVAREPVARPTPTNPSGNAGLMGLGALDLFDALESRNVVTNGEFVRVLVAMGGEEPPTNYRSALKVVAARGWIGDDFPVGADEPVSLDRAAAALAKAAGIDLPAGPGVALSALQRQGWLAATASNDGVLSGAELLGAAGALLDRREGDRAPAVRIAPDGSGESGWLGAPKQPLAPSGPRTGEPAKVATQAAPAEEEESFDVPVVEAKPRPGAPAGATNPAPGPAVAQARVPAPAPAKEQALKPVRANFPRPRPEPLPAVPARNPE